jgi:hypothetical protein
VLGQEIEQVFPEMIRRAPGGLNGEPDTEDLRIYDGSALTFVLVNAVKELAAKVEQLEQALAESRTKTSAHARAGETALTNVSQPDRDLRALPGARPAST